MQNSTSASSFEQAMQYQQNFLSNTEPVLEAMKSMRQDLIKLIKSNVSPQIFLSQVLDRLDDHRPLGSVKYYPPLPEFEVFKTERELLQFMQMKEITHKRFIELDDLDLIFIKTKTLLFCDRCNLYPLDTALKICAQLDPELFVKSTVNDWLSGQAGSGLCFEESISDMLSFYDIRPFLFSLEQAIAVTIESVDLSNLNLPNYGIYE